MSSIVFCALASGRAGIRALSRLRAVGAMLILLLTAILMGDALAEVRVPELTGRVNDLTGTLSAEQRRGLEERLAAIERRKGAQVVVLIVDSTSPETIEQFSIRVAEAWKIGRGVVDGRRVDDGVLILVAKSDRRVRIEVGYGLEGAIPDALARRIVDESIVPGFRSGDFAGGLQAGIGDLGRLIDGEPLPPPRRAAEATGDGLGDALMTGLVVAAIAGSVTTAMLGRLIGAFAGAAAGGVFAIAGGASLLSGGAVFLLALVFLLFFRGGGGGRGGSGGVWTGGGSGGTSWGGRSSGGGFSGGGGGFGGGGASGRW
jgi:uncharacterized protein